MTLDASTLFAVAMIGYMVFTIVTELSKPVKRKPMSAYRRRKLKEEL